MNVRTRIRQGQAPAQQTMLWGPVWARWRSPLDLSKSNNVKVQRAFASFTYTNLSRKSNIWEY